MNKIIPLEANHYSGAHSLRLTTEHAASSYGIPVAVLIGGPHDQMALGQQDMVPYGAVEPDPLPWLIETAKQMVAAANIAAGADPTDPVFLAFHHQVTATQEPRK